MVSSECDAGSGSGLVQNQHVAPVLHELWAGDVQKLCRRHWSLVQLQ